MTEGGGLRVAGRSEDSRLIRLVWAAVKQAKSAYFFIVLQKHVNYDQIAKWKKKRDPLSSPSKFFCHQINK